MISSLGLLGVFILGTVSFAAILVGAATATYGLARSYEDGQGAERTFNTGLYITGAGFLGLVVSAGAML